MAIKKQLSVLLFVLLTPLIPSGSLYAQNAAPFDTLEIGLQYVVNTNRNVFHDFWEPRQGLAGFLLTPFYYGDAQVGVQIVPYSDKETGTSDFTNVFIYLGWGFKWSLPYKLNWFNSLNVGSILMIFTGADINSRFESELSVGVNSRLSYRVCNRWALSVSSCSQLIFTHKRINLTFISAGISYSFPAPKGVKGFLE